MAARPPMPARRVPPPPRSPPPAPVEPAAEDDHGEADEPEAVGDAVAVVPLSKPLRQLGQTFTELRFEREPTLAELEGFPGGIASGMTTHCTELALWIVPKLCPPITRSTLRQMSTRDLMRLTAVAVGFWSDSPTTGGSRSASSPSDSAGVRKRRSD